MGQRKESARGKFRREEVDADVPDESRALDE